MLAGTNDSNNWRSIVLSLLVISFVIVGILTAIYLLGYVDEMLYWSGRRMKLGEYLQGDLTPRRMPPVWISHTHFVFQTDEGALAYLDTNNDSVSLLVTNHTLVSYTFIPLHSSVTAKNSCSSLYSRTAVRYIVVKLWVTLPLRCSLHSLTAARCGSTNISILL